MKTFPRSVVPLVALACLTGCASVTPFPSLRGGAFARLKPRVALADGEHLLGSPPKDTAMLGRILVAPYDAGRPLAEQLAPNPCAEALVDLKPGLPHDDAVESAERLSGGGPGMKTLGFVGASAASHVYYRLALRTRVEKGETRAYTECCQKADCGVGYVRALTFGEGEVALAKETDAGENADAAFDDRPVPSEYMLLERRAVRGYLAFTIEEASGAAPWVPGAAPALPGAAPWVPGTAPAVSGAALPAPAGPEDDEAFARERIEIRDVPGNPNSFRFCTVASCFSENELVRRYVKETGSHELDEFVRDRSAAFRETALGLGVLSVLAMIGGGIVMGLAHEQKTHKDEHMALAAGGVIAGMGLGTSAVALGLGTAPTDEGPVGNHLTRSQAQRFAERYNRAVRARLGASAATVRAHPLKVVATSGDRK